MTAEAETENALPGVHRVEGMEHYQAREALKNGQSLIIRSIRATDKRILQAGMHHLSNESIFFRFLTLKKELSDSELKYFTEIDFLHHVGLLAKVVEDGTEVPAGVGRYILMETTLGTPSAEVAFAVDEKYQGLGIARHLLSHLAKIARAEGIKRFVALVHPQNLRMLRVFEHCGLPMQRGSSSLGTVEVMMELGQAT